MKLVSQALRRVEGGGRPWLEFDLEVEFREAPMQMLFRVDPETKLPQFCRIEGVWEGTEVWSAKGGSIIRRKDRLMFTDLVCPRPRSWSIAFHQKISNGS